MPPQVNKRDVLIGVISIIALVSAYALAFYVGSH